MSCSHNVVFLLDVASRVEKSRLRFFLLRVLNYLGCRFGLAKVRWGFKFFDSWGAQGRTSRLGRFHQLGSRSWEDFEEELEARFGDGLGRPALPGPVPRATLTQNGLKETLLDYQWDRPEIASPAKPVLRSQKSKLAAAPDKPPAGSASQDFVNAVFLFSPCPRSQREVMQFVFGSYGHLSEELPPSQDLTEKIVPKGMQEMMAGQKITPYWVDTTESMKLLESSDHTGYRLMFDLMHLLGGTILPFETFLQSLNHHRTGTESAFPEESGTSEPPFTPWSTILPFDSTLNCLFSLPSALKASFPPLEGMLFLKTEGKEEPKGCAVSLEPLNMSQRCFTGPVNISLQSTVTGWNAEHAGNCCTESWILRSASSGLSLEEPPLFQQFIKYILAQGLHFVAEVSLSGACLPFSGIFSPISGSTAILSFLCAEQAPGVERSLLQTAREGSIAKDDDFSLPEFVSNVVNQDCDGLEKDPMWSSEETLFPEWAQQELSHTPSWSPALIEGWYPLSNLCGASPHLMESFRLLLADSVMEEEEALMPKTELAHCLSEFYQRKASDQLVTSRQQDHRKRRTIPRTPVRQKMKSMPRSLQMLNVARLNVKAQKFQPEGDPPASEKVSQRLLSRRLDDNVEGRVKVVKSKMVFTTEEEMLSYIKTNYQKAVVDGENLLTHVQDMVAIVNLFHKSNEVAFMDTIQSNLLKTSKALRQRLGSDPEKEAQVKECQLQVYLRLEMCLQCPSLQNDTDGMEQLVEEVTEMLRILCLTKDPGYLTRFLEEVVDMYLETMPKVLGDLYYSLGTQIPAKLASVLPADFFSDDSISQESQTPSLHTSASSVPVPRTASLSTEAEQLEELRTRSAKKRRNALARHRSVTETSQNLRQIEIPHVPKHRTKKDKSYACLDVNSAPAPKKMAVQEVTKVRRNLFNEKFLSSSKRSLTKFSRSQSVSALEGLKHKRSYSNEGSRDNQKLLTKMVAETPLHKQTSKRLLHKQIKGRCSDPGFDIGVVEESPEKSITCVLRRSPRIKQLSLDRNLSGPFHSTQPSKRSTQQTPSGHLEAPGDPGNVTGLVSPLVKKAVQSPKSLLFGAVLGELSLGGMDSQRTKRNLLTSDELAVDQTPRKSPLQSSRGFVTPPGLSLRRSPRLQAKQQQAAQNSPAPKHTVARRLGSLFSPSKWKGKSLPEPLGKEGGDLALPLERFLSPPKAPQLQTSGKQANQELLDNFFASATSSSDSASALPASVPPIVLNSRGRPFSKLHSLRRSLRVAQKSASPASPERSLDPESIGHLEPRWPREEDSVVLKEAPTLFGGIFSGPSSSPMSAELTEAFSTPVQSPSLPMEVKPLPWSQAVNPVSTCTASPTRTQGIARWSPTSPLRPRDITGSSPPKDSEYTSNGQEEHLCLDGERKEDQGRSSTGLSDKTHPFCPPGRSQRLFLGQRPKKPKEIVETNKRRGLERCLSPEFSPKAQGLISDAIVVCEQLDISSYLKKALPGGSQRDQGPEASHGKAFPAGKKSPPGSQQQQQRLLFQNPLGLHPPSLLAATKPSPCAYALRCTPDRRQREAEARLGNPERVATPGAPPPAPMAIGLPTYEVELEMKPSGLPKLRIKRVPSHGEPSGPKAEEEGSGLAAGDLPPASSGRQPGKPELASISPPPCLHSAPHSTPGKLGGGQTYICQSYTPTRCTASSPSSCSPPSQGSGTGVPWTPSPKHKGRVTPEAIKDWPRRKKATVEGCRKSQRLPGTTAETAAHHPAGASELFSNGRKTLCPAGEFGLEGICRLQDTSPCSHTEPRGEEEAGGGPSRLRARKRGLEEAVSPGEKGQEAGRRSGPKRGKAEAALEVPGMESRAESTEEEVFSALTPPKSSGKSTISASGLWALTQSPLLYQGRTTSLAKCSTGEDSDVFADEDVSPFRSVGTRQRCISRTYSRKKLLS